MAIALGKGVKEVAIFHTAWKAADIEDSVIFRMHCPGLSSTPGGSPPVPVRTVNSQAYPTAGL
ncbi:hypothetical protein ACIP98_23265 [Streptomyces sp. NPDC088354]|uniref:hypothetical protein n=1 Tax=unclassified Streptomyces TaxID=2593676 RepID=UPI0029BCC348|nr:hypothetical protein [Streptomyces sp. MI02-7b]MDX3073018.1 hypothetical protein [Streptomyces sp. MI02-7b]